MTYAMVTYFCIHHQGLERVRVPILRSREVRNDSLDPIVVKRPKGVFLKAVKVGSRRTGQEIEGFLKDYFEKNGGSNVEISFVG